MYSSWNLHNRYTALLLQLIYKRNYSNTTAKTRMGDQGLSQYSAEFLQQRGTKCMCCVHIRSCSHLWPRPSHVLC